MDVGDPDSRVASIMYCYSEGLGSYSGPANFQKF